MRKFSLVGGTWTANGIAGTHSDAYRGVTGVVNAGTVTLYATRKGGSAAAGGGELVSFVDSTGYNATITATPTLLATAAANTAFRGVAFAPVETPQLIVTEINSNAAGGDFWELTNVGVTTQDIGNWKWDDDSANPNDAAAVTIPAGTMIAPGESIVLTTAADAAAFRTLWSIAPTVQIIASPTGPGFGQNDQVHLFNTSGATVTSFSYVAGGFTLSSGSPSIGGHAGASAGGAATQSAVIDPAFGFGAGRRFMAVNGTPGTSGLSFGGGPSITLSLSFTASSFSESATNPASVGTVSRATSGTSDLVVTLSSSDTTEATVPATVTILANQTSANFDVTAVNDTFPDGSKTVTITASAADATTPTSDLTVTDDGDVLDTSFMLTEVQSNQSATKPTTANDYWELTNISGVTKDISGYSWHDSGRSGAAAQAYKLPPGTSIAAGESVIFTATPAADFRAWWGLAPTVQVFTSTGAPGLGSSDGVSFFDAGQNELFFFSYGIAGFTKEDGSPSTGGHAGPSGGGSADSQALIWVPASGTATPRYTAATGIPGNHGSFTAVSPATDSGSPGNQGAIIPTVSLANASINEGNSGTTVLSLPVTRSDTATAFTVDYAVTGGTATSGTDFATLASGTLTFTNGGSASQNIDITVNGDSDAEADETVIVTLSNVVNTTGATVIQTAAGTGTILNDDIVPASITTHPASVTIATGYTATLSVTAAGFPAPSFQWYQGNSGDTSTPVGTNSSSFTTPALTTTTSYWVRATNVGGPADSSTAVVTVTTGPTEINLANYVRIARINLPEPTRTALPPGTPVHNFLCQEASAVTYNWDTDTLFVTGDGGRAITQVSKTGQLIDTMTLALGSSPQGTDFYDPEGLTYIGGGQFVMSEERDRQLVKFTYVAGTTLSRSGAQTVKIGTFVDNTGTEGLSWDPQTSGFICLKELSPIGIFQTGVDFVAGTATNGSPTTVNSTNLFDPALLGMTDTADVFALSNLPSMSGQPQAGNLLVLGQEDARIVNVDRSGVITSTLNISSDPGNPLTPNGQQHEGVTMDRAGILYVVNENGGGSIDYPQLWVYAPSSLPNAAPTAVIVDNATTTLPENSSTASRVKLGNIFVTDDGLGTNTLSLSGADAASFELTGTEFFLKAGVTLDFETKSSYAVTVNADDSTVGTTPDASVNFTLTISDVEPEAPPAPVIIISEVAPWASSNSAVAADWFEITNVTSNPINITGWKIDDSSAAFGSAATLNGVTTLAPGESAIFIETADLPAKDTLFRSTWFGANPPAGLQIGSYTGAGLGLSSTSDGVNIFNAAGTLMASVSFGASDAVSPFQTFDNTRGLNATTISQLSLVGTNGAIASSNAAEVGSPGFAAPGVLRITEVAAWGSGNGNYLADWFEVTNTGARAVDISGWKMDDSSESPAAALSLTGVTSIAPGESVIFLETATPVTTIATFRSTWFSTTPPPSLQIGSYTGSGAGLSTGGDAVVLYDTNNVRQAKVFFGASPVATPFATFDNSVGADNVNLATLSAVGTNGAFVALTDADEIGSPGTTVSAAQNDTTIVISDASLSEGNSGSSTLSFTVTRSDRNGAFTVDFATSNGTATAGSDYAAASGTLTFIAGGSTTQNVSVSITGDTAVEANETFIVTLSNVVNTAGTATITDATGTGTISNDDITPVVFPASNSLSSTVKGSIALAGAEIPAFDPLSDRAFASSGAGIQVVNLADPANPVFINTITPSTLGVVGLTSDDISSVAVRKGSGSNPSVLAAAIISNPKTNPGFVVFLNAATGALISHATVGVVPDHIAFTPDGSKLLVCNEGELSTPEVTIEAAVPDAALGTVSIIAVDAAGVAGTVQTADFTAFDAQTAALKTAGVRIFDDGVPSTDFEPEYLAISPDGTKAMVTLQEANAVAVLDIASATFTSVAPLGKKNFSALRADFSDADGMKNPRTGQPVFGLYMPDAIASFSSGGQTYYVTANEGDDRNDFIAQNETITVNSGAYDLDNAVFPNEADLKLNANLGKLTVSNLPGLRGDTDNDGDIDEILMYGARSFSILDSTGALVFDSGDMIEMIVASLHNSNFDDGRSDNKGPEPEGVAVATLGARTFAFVGLERSHMTLVFDVTNPLTPTYVTSLVRSGDLNPEGIVVVSESDSPSGRPLVLVTNESSNTLSVFELTPATAFTMQLLHLADAEAGLLASQTAPNLAALVDAFDGTYANTLILAGGDNYIPGPFAAAGTDALVAATHNKGNNPFAADIEIHNRLGVEASTIGNHEFDFGTNAFSDAIGDTNFPYLSSNLDFSGDSGISARYQETVGVGGLEEASSVKNKIVPSCVVTKGTEKIGLVGVTTQILEGISSTGGVEVKGFVGDGSEMDNMVLLASQVQPVINELKSQGVNKIILMAHLQQIANELMLAPMLTDVDIILAAGSNTRLGDANDVAVAFTGHAANFAGNYPIYTAGADGKPTVVVNTDNEFTYLGRLVADFDADGLLIVPNLLANTTVNGAYAATASNVAAAWGVAEVDLPTTAFASGTKGALVKQITDAVQGVITTKDGDVRGFTSVYLEGERSFVRNQETNLGNISADSMITVGKTALPAATHVAALKNGGGIRAAIGAVEVATGAKLPPLANPAAGKPAGAISLLDIENSMRFNNGLMLCDTTPAGLKAILEHGVALLGNQGRFPQIGGIRFSFNPSGTVGSRIQSIVTIDDSGAITGRVVSGGAVLPTAPATITLVTLNFLANGGDGYPFKANADNFRFLLNGGGLSAAIDESLSFTATGVVPVNILGEQAALSSHLQARYATAPSAYDLAETAPALDTRIQSTAVRTDTVLDGPATFASWLADNGYSGTAGGDTDNDGVPDSLEYFFNANPNNGGDRDNLPTVTMNGSDLEFRFTYLTSTVFPGYLQCSEDLIAWANATPGVDYEVITETVNGNETAVRFRIFCNPLPTTQGPFTYLTPFTTAVGRGAIDQLTITNHGMVGAGRLSGDSYDSFGETMGAASGLSITGWNYNSGTGQFSGVFNVLPDRGYNSGTTFSNYAARVHQTPFTFTPYYGAGPVPQTQIVPTYGSTTKFTYLDGATMKFTTGLNATAVTTIMGQSVGTTAAANGPGGATENLISFDAEAIHVFADGSGFVSDEYGTYIARFNAAKQFTRIIQLPAAAQPHKPVGTLNFDSTTAPTNGRRNNQGLEGMAVSPDNSRLFALMQSALIQDGGAAQTRYNTRLFVYDIAGANLEDPVLIGEYAVQLPRYDLNGNNSGLDATASQSEIVALSSTQLLMLPRDGNGLGKGDTTPPVVKTVDLVDFSAATNILGLYDAEGNQISPSGTLRTTITPARSTVVVNLLSSTDLAKFGFNTNTAAPNQFTVNEKAEGMALVPDTSTASTEDYFLFVANDNDFQSSDVRMIDAAGNLVSYGDARDRGITNDAVFTAWRITICPNNRKFFRIQVDTAP
jgi:uncharacterized protein YjiK/2',3'-cyclic-nucleotide 2'-phosphodiesterase (5'-nucleotidase family)